MHTLASPLQHAVSMAANKIALIDGEDVLTYTQLYDRCRCLAAALYDLKLEAGDRVAILALNCKQYVETYIAVPAAGLVVVPLNTRHTDTELAYVLEDSGAKVLITDRNPGALARSVEHVIALPDEYESALQQATPMALGNGVQETDLAGLFYTGGTTGASKGVMLSHRNLIMNTFHWLTMVPQDMNDVYLVMAPLFHAAGSNSVLGNIWHQSQQVILPAFDPSAVLDLIERHRVTYSLAVPVMLAAIAEEQIARPRNTTSLRGIAHGGSPIATELVRRTHQALPTAEIVEIYGATELSPLATALRHEEKLLDDVRGRSCGQPMIGCELRILSPEGKDLPRGDIGEIVVRGGNVMLGYWNKPEQTAEVLKDGGWYWTQDLGYMDENGYVYLVDRFKDMIISGGENIYCTEVEEVLYKHPAVLQAAVFGIPDGKWGEAVQAAIVLRQDHKTVSKEDIIAFCRKSLADYKVPKDIDFREQPLPVSGPGKVLKRELRAPYWEGKERRIN